MCVSEWVSEFVVLLSWWWNQKKVTLASFTDELETNYLLIPRPVITVTELVDFVLNCNINNRSAAIGRMWFRFGDFILIYHTTLPLGACLSLCVCVCVCVCINIMAREKVGPVAERCRMRRGFTLIHTRVKCNSIQIHRVGLITASGGHFFFSPLFLLDSYYAVWNLF